MIKVVVERPTHTYSSSTRKDFNCPYCGKDDYFWANIPERCTGCGRILPIVHEFLKEPEILYQWHTNTLPSKTLKGKNLDDDSDNNQTTTVFPGVY